MRYVFFCILFSIQFSALSQVREYQVGDTIPDFEIKNIINFERTSAKISDFKGKLLILDFWATWCAPCIKAMSKLDSIQKKFQNKLQILPVTYEDSTIVSRFINRMSRIMNIVPATVVNDNLLQNKFWHTSLPHYVWIDGKRIVIAITEANDVSVENIARYLNGEGFKYTLKRDEERILIAAPAFFPAVQVLNDQDTTLERLDDSSLITHSILTGYIAGLSSGGSFRDSTYFSLRNLSIATLYKFALFGNSNSAVTNTSSVKVDISDPILFKKVSGKSIDGTRMSSGLESLEWIKENGYCYESKVPPILSKERFKIMEEELNRFFSVKYGIIGTKETVKRKCLALVRISKEDKMATKGSEPTIQIDKFSFKMTNLRIYSFIERMALAMQTLPPIIDETNYSGKIDLDLNCNFSDLKALNKELEKYGLRLNEKEAMMETAIVRLKKVSG